MSEGNTGCRWRTRTRCVWIMLAASLLGAAALAFITGRGQWQQQSSIPLSDARSPAATAFESARTRPQHVEPVEDLSSTERVSVYVYDGVPELDYSGLIECFRDRNDGVPPWQDERAEVAQNMGEIWLHRALLSHPWRVLDPEKADLFYVPMYPVLSFQVELGAAGRYGRTGPPPIEENRCEGLTHTARMDAAVEYLSLSSPFFNRYGGADHVIVCAWWNCRVAVGKQHRMLLRRTVIGINERVFHWHRWGCGPRRVVTIPYAASSVLTTKYMIGGRPTEERDISFFFVGTARNRPERQNLDVVRKISQDSVILLGDDAREWDMNSTVYADHMARSRFCFCPRGDTLTSRRFFDALAAACVPILTELGAAALPFVRAGLNFSEFAIVVDREAFSSRENVTQTTLDVLARSDEELADLRSGLTAARSSIVYGFSTGASIGDMHPYLGTVTKFLQASYKRAGGEAEVGQAGQEEVKTNMWNCPPTRLPEANLAARTEAKLPPVAWQRRQWLAESETIVNKQRSLLFCAPPNAGSLQFRMLAKRMQGVSHWSVADDWSLLFDPTASELELLDVTDGPLMTKIFSDNGSGWIKVAVVRDPVTRLLSAYLDIVRMWRAGLEQQEEEQEEPQSTASSPKFSDAEQQMEEQSSADDRTRQLRQDATSGGLHEKASGRITPLRGASSEWGLLETILERRRQRQQRAGMARSGNGEMIAARNDQHEEAKNDEGSGPFSRESLGGRDGTFAGAEQRLTAGEERTQDHANRSLGADEVYSAGGGVRIPTFAEVVEALKVKPWEAPVAFRPSVSLCGQQNSPFDSVIPFERLQNTSTEVLKSLPGDIWESFGASGWGPDGKHAFMEFDYGGAAWRRNVGVQIEDGQQEEGRDADPLPPRRASDLFEGESCAWAEYYGDMEALESVGELYALDYSQFRWYQLDPWRERLQACTKRRNR